MPDVDPGVEQCFSDEMMPVTLTRIFLAAHDRRRMLTGNGQQSSDPFLKPGLLTDLIIIYELDVVRPWLWNLSTFVQLWILWTTP